MTITQIPASPRNYQPGEGRTVDRIVVHVMDGSLVGTDAWFANPTSGVSAHYGVGADGETHQYVAEQDIAWHAGNWAMNQRSVGIEHEGRQEAGPDWVPSTAQLAASIELAADVCRRWDITPSEATILPHSSINPRHARCPGAGFPLNRYIAEVRARLGPAHIPVRLFDPVSNVQIGTGTLIASTDKVYVASLDDGR